MRRRQPFVRMRQRGVSMLVALFALIVILLGSAAMMLNVDTSALIAGNLAFKQDATESASVGSEQAMAWMQSTLDTESFDTFDFDIPAAGYYASSLDDLDPTGTQTSSADRKRLVDWDNNGCAGIAPATFVDCVIQPGGADKPLQVNGNTVQWVIFRLCRASGPMTPENGCSKPPNAVNADATSDRGELGQGGRIGGSESGPFFRVIVRVVGARGTTSFTETIFYF